VCELDWLGLHNSFMDGEAEDMDVRSSWLLVVGMGCGWRCGFVSSHAGVDLDGLVTCNRVTMGMPTAPVVVN